MAEIKSTDIIFATVRQFGQITASLRCSGVTSFSDILSELSGRVSGLATIQLRNSTRGWNSSRTVMI